MPSHSQAIHRTRGTAFAASRLATMQSFAFEHYVSSQEQADEPQTSAT